MNKTLVGAALVASLVLTACASERDHFYVLNVLPDASRTAASAPTVHVLLSVSIPSLVDRAEMIVSTSHNDIRVLDHQRWAVNLSELVFQTLARDIEMRRADILIGDRTFDRAATPAITLRVDIVRMMATQSGNATVEAHWRVIDATAGIDQIGSDVFDAPVEATDYASVARGYSLALSALADTLAATIRVRTGN